jgi:hypothetical protein
MARHDPVAVESQAKVPPRDAIRSLSITGPSSKDINAARI